MTGPRSPPIPYRREPDFLPEAEHAALLAWTLANAARFAPSRIAEGRIEPQVRQSLSLRDLQALAAPLEARMLALAPRLMRQFGMHGALSRVELEVVAHGHGGRFHRHVDTAIGDARQRGARIISAVCYFHCEPKAFSGGQLRLHGFGAATGGDVVDIEPEQNLLVAFPAFVSHEVLPVACAPADFSASRFALNAWFHRPA